MTVASPSRWPRSAEPLTAHAASLSNHVHVWGTPLTVPPAAQHALAGVLSPDERERASRFHFDRDRARYIAARGCLRLLLAAYTGRVPADLRFDYGAHGKPALRDPPATGDLRFNLSHAGNVAVYAVTRGRDVGIDVERLRDVPEMGEIVERWLPPVERDRYARCEPGDRVRAFFTAWTRQEALLKARGDGLSAFAHVDAEGWALVALEPAPGYVATLAVTGEEPAIRCWWADPLV